jgi:hypothetical protein
LIVVLVVLGSIPAWRSYRRRERMAARPTAQLPA